MIIEFGNDVDVSVLEVGKEYKLSFEYKGNPYTINRALIKGIDVENNSATIEPLADIKEEPKFEDISNRNITMQIFNKITGEKVMDFKI
jgi:hypothetical protein